MYTSPTLSYSKEYTRSSAGWWTAAYFQGAQYVALTEVASASIPVGVKASGVYVTADDTAVILRLLFALPSHAQMQTFNVPALEEVTGEAARQVPTTDLGHCRWLTGR